MACISPITLRQGKSLNSFPCGKCNFCLQDRRNDWTFRLSEEMKVSKSAYFLTMTYDEKHQPFNDEGYAQLNKKDVQAFIKRVRKSNDAEVIPHNPYDLEVQEWPPIKYYTVGEYGSNTFRPHYHSIIFNIKPKTLSKIDQLWNKGFIVVGKAEPASIHYTTKYVLNKKDGWVGINRPFALISQGIGKSYLGTNGHRHKSTLSTVVKNDQGMQRLPRYYKDKIFSIKDKEQIKKQSIADSDESHKDLVHSVKTFHPEPENYVEFMQRQKLDAIEKTIKGNINPESI